MYRLCIGYVIRVGYVIHVGYVICVGYVIHVGYVIRVGYVGFNNPLRHTLRLRYHCPLQYVPCYFLLLQFAFLHILS